MNKITKSYLRKARQRLKKSCQPKSDATEFSNALSDYVDALLEFHKKPVA